MKKMLLMLCAAVGLLAASAKTPENAVLVSGNLKKADGSAMPADVSFAMTFRIYDSPNGTNVYWQCKLPVTFNENGDFSVKLQDGFGTPDGGAKLADCAGLENWYVSLQMEHCREIPSRIRIVRQFAAFHADCALTASNVTANAIETGAFKANGKLTARNLKVGRTVGNKIGTDGRVVSPGIKVVPNGDFALGGTGGIKVKGDIRGITHKTLQEGHATKVPLADSPGDCPVRSDAIALALNELHKMYYSMPIPAGSKIKLAKVPLYFNQGTSVTLEHVNAGYFDNLKLAAPPYWPNVVFELFSFGKQEW